MLNEIKVKTNFKMHNNKIKTLVSMGRLINMRNLFYMLTGLLLFGSSGPMYAQSKSPVKSEKPNIIFILTDDQRWDALGYAGNDVIHTPEMDKLASTGTYFSNAMVTTPICAASRASLFTGLQERTHRFDFQTGNVKDKYMNQAYPKLLKDAGYYTGFFGKFGVKYDHLDKLFNVYDEYDRAIKPDKRSYFYKTIGKDTVHLTRYTGYQGLNFIENAPEDKPFCLQLCFSAPHAADGAEEQYFWQKETDYLFQDVEMAPAKLSDDKYFNALPQEVREGFNRLRWTWRYDTPEKYQHSVKGYYRMIAGIDLEIGKIRELLDKKGIADNTVIVLMGDNGYFMGERQLAGKWLMYDNSLRVPLVILDPRAEKHLDTDVMALNIDVPATILDLAGVEAPKSWHGKSLTPIVWGKQKTLGRDTVLVEHLWDFEHIPPSEAVRTDTWKYMRYVNDKSIEELYNLEKDPMEVKDLSKNKKYQKTKEELRLKLDELTEKFSDELSQGPHGLNIEFIRDPQGVEIIDDTPEFAWIVPATAIAQKGYQLLVSSTLEKSNNNIGDLWNTGHLGSNRSINITYNGKPLEVGKSYYWKVRIWDVDNRTSRYSAPQKFKIGEKDQWFSTGNKFQMEKIKPTNSQIHNQVLSLDFGKAAFASLQINYKAQKEETLTVRLGETLKDGRIDLNPGGTIRSAEVQLNVNPSQSNYQIELVPDERNTKSIAVTMPDSFPIILPFRYAEIEGAGNPAGVEAEQLAFFNYFDESSSAFKSSNTLLNQVWDLCKYSIKATTFAGFYVDGDRERIPYEADAYLNQLSHYAVDNEYSIARKTIEYFMIKPTWPTEWQLHVALLFYQDYMYTGNTELIEKYYDQLKHKTLIALEEENGLITTASPRHNGRLMQQLGFSDTTKRLKDIVDWPQKGGFGGVMGETDDFEFKPFNTVINSFYYKNMKIMELFANLLNKPGDALDFELRAARTKKAINTLLWDEDGGRYVDGIGSKHASLHANMMPLAFGVVPETRKQSVGEHVKSRGMACSVYGSQFLMEALYEAGEDKYALDLMTATHDRSWYNMIKVGSTITMEAWDMKYKPNADWNHAWGAAPANIIPRGLWGIQPLKPGFGHFRIRPQLANLSHAEIKVPTIGGEINATYRKMGALQQLYTFSLPGNMSAELVLDDIANKDVMVNGEKVNTGAGFIFLKPGVQEVMIRINTF